MVFVYLFNKHFTYREIFINIIVLLITLLLLIIVSKSLKVKTFATLDTLLITVTFVVFNIPVWTSPFIEHSYDRLIFILLVTTILHGLVFYNRNESWIKYREVLRLFIPLLPLFVKGIGLELAIVFSVIIYNLTAETMKLKIESLLSYLIAGCAIIKIFVESYYSSSLSIVNYQIIDLFKYLPFGICFLCFCAMVYTIHEWENDKESRILNIYWPFIFLVLSLHLSKWQVVYDQYLLFLTFCLSLVSLFLWREKYTLAIVSAVSSLLFVPSVFFLFPLIILVIIHYQNKVRLIASMLKYESLDIATLVIIVAIYQFDIAFVGVFSILMFLFMIRNLNNEIIIE